MTVFKKEKGSMDGVVVRTRTPKKVVTKTKKIQVTDAVKPVVIVDAPEEHLFWVYQGGALRNLRDLVEALEGMSEEQFEFHTKRNGNDFAHWIRETFHETELADRLERLRARSGMLRALHEAID